MTLITLWFWQDVLYSKGPFKLSSSKLLSERYPNLPSGYWPININWKDLDRCNVCHMDEVRNKILILTFFFKKLFAVLEHICLALSV